MAPLPYAEDKVQALRAKHAQGLVIGLKNVAGSVDRKDVDVLLSEDQDTFNLFILALRNLQYDPELSTSLMSYFEIAGKRSMGRISLSNCLSVANRSTWVASS
jgi:hypothetical protein